MLADVRGQRVVHRVQRFEHPVDQSAEDTGRDLADGVIDGDDAAGVERIAASVFVAREDFELRVEDHQIPE